MLKVISNCETCANYLSQVHLLLLVLMNIYLLSYGVKWFNLNIYVIMKCKQINSRFINLQVVEKALNYILCTVLLVSFP